MEIHVVGHVVALLAVGLGVGAIARLTLPGRTSLPGGLTMLVAWVPLAPVLEAPAVKLLGGDIPNDSTVFSYPFVMLWLLPFGAVAATVLLRSVDKHWHARMAALFPAVLIACGCFWLFFLSDSYS